MQYLQIHCTSVLSDLMRLKECIHELDMTVAWSERHEIDPVEEGGNEMGRGQPVRIYRVSSGARSAHAWNNTLQLYAVI